MIVAALIFGVSMVMPIGGADMPVVISLLNAFTGTAVAMAGFVIGNWALIIAGALVGASGGILTKLMADAMNRSIRNIIVGGFGTGDTAAAVAGPGGSVQSIAGDDAAIQLAYASKVIIVPGYGLAAAQAQHEVAALAEVLESRGIDVSYAIHPVAGRMPGHMNVLLAEANVPYPQLKEMDEINPEFARTDVALVIGANDVTNPAARRAGTAISGMPILDVDQAKSIIVIKRSMGHGYAGIDNELYVDPKTSMYFADAKKALSEMTSAGQDTGGLTGRSGRRRRSSPVSSPVEMSSAASSSSARGPRRPGHADPDVAIADVLAALRHGVRLPADALGCLPGAARRRGAGVLPGQVLLEPGREHEPVGIVERCPQPRARDCALGGPPRAAPSRQARARHPPRRRGHRGQAAASGGCSCPRMPSTRTFACHCCSGTAMPGGMSARKPRSPAR